jgi:hypothetical protein
MDDHPGYNEDKLRHNTVGHQPDVIDRELLARLAHHSKTGKPLPLDLAARLMAAGYIIDEIKDNDA